MVSGHLVLGSFNNAGVPRIILQTIEVGKVQVGAIEKETNDLVKERVGGNSLRLLRRKTKRRSRMAVIPVVSMYRETRESPAPPVSVSEVILQTQFGT